MIRIVIGENEAGQRADRFLRKYLGNAPLSAVYRIIRKDLKVNGKRVREDTQLAAGDEVTLYLTQAQVDAFTKAGKSRPAPKRQFGIAYEDDQVLIVNKPAGLLVHGDKKEKRNTLVNQVCGYLQGKGEYDPAREKTFVPSPVNRIDRNTSGLVIFGKTAPALRALTALIRQREGIRKFYLAVARGQVTEDMVLRDRLVKDEAANRVRVAKDAAADQAPASRAAAVDACGARRDASDTTAGIEAPVCDASAETAGCEAATQDTGATEPAGQAAETRVHPLDTGRRYSLVEAELVTGRTHQIRVHLAQAGHPLAGDPKYGATRDRDLCRKFRVRGQLLHAWRLKFGRLDQPLEELSGKTITAKPPKAFEQAAEELIHGV